MTQLFRAWETRSCHRGEPWGLWVGESVLWGGGIQAGFVEEVLSGLGFEAQAAFHWFENQEGDLSGQKE